jgi:hypothetical protein
VWYAEQRPYRVAQPPCILTPGLGEGTQQRLGGQGHGAEGEGGNWMMGWQPRERGST